MYSLTVGVGERSGAGSGPFIYVLCMGVLRSVDEAAVVTINY